MEKDSELIAAQKRIAELEADLLVTTNVRDSYLKRVKELEARSAGSSPAESDTRLKDVTRVSWELVDTIHELRERNSRLVECLQYFIMFAEGAKRFGIELENSSMMAKAKAAIESEEKQP